MNSPDKFKDALADYSDDPVGDIGLTQREVAALTIVPHSPEYYVWHHEVYEDATEKLRKCLPVSVEGKS